MIRAVYRDGVIYPAEPVPPEWTDGEEVRVEWGYDDPSDDPEELDRWDAEMKRVGGLQFEPGEEARFEAVMEEADAVAKAYVRRQMESGS